MHIFLENKILQHTKGFSIFKCQLKNTKFIRINEISNISLYMINKNISPYTSDHV